MAQMFIALGKLQFQIYSIFNLKLFNNNILQFCKSTISNFSQFEYSDEHGEGK